MSFPGVLRARLRSSHCSTKSAYSPAGTHMWPFGPFCAMFGVSKISIRSRCCLYGLVGGQTAAGGGRRRRGG